MNTTGEGRVVYTDLDGDGFYDDVVYTVPMNSSNPEVHYRPHPDYNSQHSTPSASSLPKVTKKDVKRFGKFLLVMGIIGFLSMVVMAIIFSMMFIFA